MTIDLHQASASIVADQIRSLIVAGELRPGVRLTEADVRAELGVSRSTLREALRSLVQDRLVVHHLSRGFFVRELDLDDIHDIYAVRRTVGCGALLRCTTPRPEALRQLSYAVEAGQRALESQSWQTAASVSLAFHEALVDLADSPRLSEINRRALAEFRLAHAFMDDPREFHVPFIDRHETIADQVEAGEFAAAATTLESYLDDSEAAVLVRINRGYLRTAG